MSKGGNKSKSSKPQAIVAPPTGNNPNLSMSSLGSRQTPALDRAKEKIKQIKQNIADRQASRAAGNRPFNRPGTANRPRPFGLQVGALGNGPGARKFGAGGSISPPTPVTPNPSPQANSGYDAAQARADAAHLRGAHEILSDPSRAAGAHRAMRDDAKAVKTIINSSSAGAQGSTGGVMPPSGDSSSSGGVRPLTTQKKKQF